MVRLVFAFRFSLIEIEGRKGYQGPTITLCERKAKAIDRQNDVFFIYSGLLGTAKTVYWGKPF